MTKLIPWISYPGSYTQQNYKEDLDHGYLIWDIDAKSRKHDVEFVVLPNPRPFVTVDWAGDEAEHRMKKHPKTLRYYRKVFHPKNPKQRPGKFASDLVSVGSTAAGIHAAEKYVPKGKRGMAAKLIAGVLGHTAGRYIGNKLGNRINTTLYGKPRNKKR